MKHSTKKLGFAVTAASILIFTAGGSSFGAVEQDAGGQVPPDMSQDAGSTPGGYAIPPVSPKSFKPAENHPYAHKTVKSPRGETLGTIDHVLEGTDKGQDMYAMLRLDDHSAPIPIPLTFLRESEMGLILNATKAQLEQVPGGPNLGGRGKSQDFEHHGSEPLKPNLRQGGS